MRWKTLIWLLLFTIIWLAACTQPSQESATPVADEPVQDNFFIVENARLTDGTYTVPPGESVTLRWHITSSKEVYIKQTVQYGTGADKIIGPLPSEGTLEVCPMPSLTLYYLGNTADSYELTLTTYAEISIEQPIDLEAACWGSDGDYLLSTHGKALMNDMVLLLWSAHDVEWVTIMTSYGTEPVDHYGALPPSGVLAVCEQNEAVYTLHPGDRPPLQVTVSRANTAQYAGNRVYGECPFTGPISWP